jgi:hypothetical protein
LVTRAGKTTTIEFEPSFRINIAQNINYGTNFLADANKPALGYGFDFGFMSYSKFNAYFGYEHSYYHYKHRTNINSTRLNTLSFKVLYEHHMQIFRYNPLLVWVLNTSF